MDKSVNKYEINVRIRELMIFLGFNQNQFSMTLNTSSSRISNILRHRNKPDSDILVAICVEFRDVDARWLLTGEGNMFYGSSDMLKESSKIYGRKEKIYPFTQIDFMKKFKYLETRINKLEMQFKEKIK